MPQYDVLHIDGGQFRSLKQLVADGTVKAVITFRRLRSFLPDLPDASETLPSQEAG